MPPMLGDMVVQMMADGGPLEVVGQSDDDQQALTDARQRGADLIIIRADALGPSAMLAAAVGPEILAIAADAHSGTIFSVAGRHVTLDRASLSSLALKLRGHA